MVSERKGEATINIQIQTHLNIPDLEMNSDVVAELVAKFADLVVQEGLGNQADEEGNIDCIIIVKGEDTGDHMEFLAEVVSGAWAICLPTDDMKFVEKSKEEGYEIEG